MPLRATTPAINLGLLLTHVMSAAAASLDWDRIQGFRAIVSSAARPSVNAPDAWRGAALALQRGDSAAVCGTYRLLRRSAAANGSPREISLRLSRSGRYAAAEEQPRGDAAMVMLAFACYRATRNADWMRGEMPLLIAAAGRAGATRDPLAAEATLSLAELDDDLARQPNQPPSTRGDSLRAAAEPMRAYEPEQRAATVRWSEFTTALNDAIARDYGRLSSGDSLGGLSLATAGGIVDALGRDLFGVEEALDGIVISPGLDGIADDFTWRLDGWQLSRDTVSIAYRPADRAMTIRTGASRRIRLLLSIPWLRAESCVRSRRGAATDQLTPVMLTDGSAYVDLRPYYEPAEVTISSLPCQP